MTYFLDEDETLTPEQRKRALRAHDEAMEALEHTWQIDAEFSSFDTKDETSERLHQIVRQVYDDKLSELEIASQAIMRLR